jgi:hypothetical protein
MHAAEGTRRYLVTEHAVELFSRLIPWITLMMQPMGRVNWVIIMSMIGLMMYMWIRLKMYFRKKTTFCPRASHMCAVQLIG